MHVCMDCYEYYDHKFLKRDVQDMYVCPKTSCSGDVVEIDELIAPTIILLNQKGYITKYCCSGHWYSECSTPYIYFYDFVELPEILPYGFKYEQTNTIRKRFDDFEDEYLNKYNFIVQTNKDLYEWAFSLTEFEY